MAYSNASSDKIYSLLPVHIRQKDAEQGEALRGLLRLVERQADIVEADIAQLLDNAFIETCEPWAVPYIGDLVGTTPLFDADRARSGATAQELFLDLEGPQLRAPFVLRGRADVAKTIYYRRRKGTLPMLEELARDVTGWAAHAVEFFELLGWTQWLRNHIRAVRTPDIRSVERMDRLDRAFDEICHTVDVRPIGPFKGWHNIRNIGFFLWRLGAYRIEAADARPVGPGTDYRYHFSPLGQDAPLFSRLRREGNEAGSATELHVPQAIRAARFFKDLSDYKALLPPPLPFTEFYGLFNELAGLFNIAPAPAPSLAVVFYPIYPPNNTAPPQYIDPTKVVCRNLEVWSQPLSDQIGIDPVRGRLALGSDYVPTSGEPSRFEVYFHYGFPADMGGGPYRRRAWLTRKSLAARVYVVDDTGTSTFPTIAAALAQWIGEVPPPLSAIIRVQTNRTYKDALAVDLNNRDFLSIEAADGFRPHLQLPSPFAVTGSSPQATLTLGGLLIEGRIDVSGELRKLRLIHTTLIPGCTIAEGTLPSSDPSVTVAGGGAGNQPLNTAFRLEAAFSIMGALHVPEHAQGIFALDCIIDRTGPAAQADDSINAIAPCTPTGLSALAGDSTNAPCAPLWLERTTVRGDVYARQIDLASEVVFDGVVSASRIQVGCVRFSFVCANSRTPHRYRCQPDLAEQKALDDEELRAGPLSDLQKNAIRERERLRVQPEYTSEQYGQPAYLQLSLGGPLEIATGAEDGSEMGVYSHLKQPQREANLAVRLEEYLPFGLEAGFIYVT